VDQAGFQPGLSLPSVHGRHVCRPYEYPGPPRGHAAACPYIWVMADRPLHSTKRLSPGVRVTGGCEWVAMEN